MRLSKTELGIVALPVIVGTVGTVGSWLGHHRNWHWFSSSSFGSTALWFSGTASLTAVLFVLREHQSSRRREFQSKRRRVAGLAVVVEALLLADPDAEDSHVAVALATSIGAIGENVHGDEDLLAAFEGVATTAWSPTDRVACLAAVRLLIDLAG